MPSNAPGLSQDFPSMPSFALEVPGQPTPHLPGLVRHSRFTPQGAGIVRVIVIVVILTVIKVIVIVIVIGIITKRENPSLPHYSLDTPPPKKIAETTNSKALNPGSSTPNAQKKTTRQTLNPIGPEVGNGYRAFEQVEVWGPRSHLDRVFPKLLHAKGVKMFV